MWVRISVVLPSQTAFSLYTKQLDTNVKDPALYSEHTLFQSLQEDRLFPLTLLVVFLSLAKKIYDQYFIWAKTAVLHILLQTITTKLLPIQRNKTWNILCLTVKCSLFTVHCSLFTVHCSLFTHQQMPCLLNLEQFKIYIKIYTNIAPTCFGLRRSSGSLYWAAVLFCTAHNTHATPRHAATLTQSHSALHTTHTPHQDMLPH
jgi:hypothetical protein